jgi:exonuclease I
MQAAGARELQPFLFAWFAQLQAKHGLAACVRDLRVYVAYVSQWKGCLSCAAPGKWAQLS